MRIHLNQGGISVVEADSLDILRATPDDTFDSFVTDPPYGLSFMGRDWDKALPPIEIWEEALRTAKPGAHLVAFGAPRIYHRLACQIEDAGWQIRDCLQWLYGSGFPKSLNVSIAIDKAAGVERAQGPVAGRSGAGRMDGYGLAQGGNYFESFHATPEAERWDGWGTALKPAYEPILLARKPLCGTVAANVLEHGTGGINVGGCRVGSEELPARVAGQARLGTFERGHMATPTREGRWPANLILDEEAGAMLGDPARFFYAPKASRKEREAGLDALALEHVDPNRAEGSAGRDSPRAGAGRGSERKNNHPTVKPLALMRWLTRLVTPPGGLVCDPFLGSGTGGIAAKLEGFRHLGIEMDARFAAIAAERIRQA